MRRQLPGKFRPRRVPGWLVRRTVLAPWLSGFFLLSTTLAGLASGPRSSQPTVSKIPDQQIVQNRMLAVPFTVEDADDAFPDLTLRATSSNPELIPDGFMRIRGSGRHRALHLRPRLDQTGMATVTVAVTDAEGHARQSAFKLAVVPASAEANPMLLASALISEEPPAITLVWNAFKRTDHFTVYRRARGATDWGPPLVSKLPPATRSFTDTQVAVGSAFEYQIKAEASLRFHLPALLAVGIETPLVDRRGTLLLLVDATQAAALAFELDRLQHDLSGDGWSVVRHDVSPAAPVAEVKELIQNEHARHPEDVKAVFLFGHIPIPYSGWLNPDFHHHRAFPADVFYAELDGRWTDDRLLVTETVPPVPGERRVWQENSRPETRNFPGDGRYDQSLLPSDVDLQIGRVDLFNMPAFLPAGETELLRQYLDKNHRYRHHQVPVERRGLVDGWTGPFAQHVASLLGPEAITEAPFLAALNRGRFLWAGRGQFAHYHGFNDGGGSTTALARQAVGAVFMELFGSYFCEWDYWDNFLRAPLCAPTLTLACNYGSRPLWQMHPLALGETLGHCARLSQNQPDRGYQTDLASRNVHVALLGDPTLRLHPVRPVTELAGQVTRGAVRLTWKESSEAVEGYHVYRAARSTGPFSRLTDDLLRITTYEDARPPAGTHTYLVRAVKLELTPGGTYFNPSQGTRCQVTVAATPDTRPPSVALRSPPAGASLCAPVVLAAVATDDREIARLEFRVDGLPLTTLTQPPFTATWQPGGSTEAIHRVQVVAYDSSGNQAEHQGTFRLVPNETTPPTLTLREPSNHQTLWGNVIVRADADDATGVDRVELWVDGTRHSLRTNPPYHFLWQTFDPAKIHNYGPASRTVADGPHRLMVRAVDRLGNRAERAVNVVVDRRFSRPTLFLADVQTNPVSQGDLVRMTYHWEGGPMEQLWSCFLHLVNAQTGQAFTVDSHPPPRPTPYWSGPYQYPVWFKLNAAIPPGIYKMMAGLYAASQRAELNPGPGVTTDHEGRCQIGTLTLGPDTVPPAFLGSSLTNGARISGSVTITVQARDLNRLERIEVAVDGSLVGTRPAGELIAVGNGIYEGRFSWNSVQVSTAAHDVTFRIFDAAGNHTNATINLHVANPVLHPARPAQVTTAAGEQCSVNLHWAGGPLPFASEIITDLLPVGEFKSCLSGTHTPDPPITAWTGGDVIYPLSFKVPANLPPATYRIAVMVCRTEGPNAGELLDVRTAEGVEVLQADPFKLYVIGTLTVTNQAPRR